MTCVQPGKVKVMEKNDYHKMLQKSYAGAPWWRKASKFKHKPDQRATPAD